MKLASVFLAAAAVALSAAAAEPQPAAAVWRIGTFDHSSEEFSARAERSREPAFIPGQSDPAVDWPAAQAIAHRGSSPRSVAFNLDAAPAADADYRLRLAVLFDWPSVPALRVTINGKQGQFYFHPQLDREFGDRRGARPTYSHAELQIDFPGSYLSAGRNEISFQPVSISAHSVPEAGLNWDALELSLAPGSLVLRQTVSVDPTIFYRTVAGQLCELVDVDVHDGASTAGRALELELAGHRYRQAFRGGGDFGEERFEFAVPEFSGPAAARVTVEANGRSEGFDLTVVPAKKWTVFIVPHTHLDIGYSDYQAKIATLQARDLDEAVDLAAQYPGYCFSTDGSWCLEQFMDTRSPEDQRRLIQAMKEGKVFVPANYCSMLTGFPSAETLIRSLYYSANFSRRFGTPFDYATITDTPSYTWSYASVLASAGVGYFMAGGNPDRGPILLKGDLAVHNPMAWEGPDGQTVLFWYAQGYAQAQSIFGLPPIVDAGREMLPIFLQTYDNPIYRSDAVAVYGTQGDNHEIFPQQADLVERWSREYAYPQLKFSGVREALTTIAQRAGAAPYVERGDGGPYWEDDIAANPIHAAMERHNESRGPSAEKFATITELVNPRLAADRHRLAEMWNEMVLYDEHNCLMIGAAYDHATDKEIAQIETKNAHAVRAGQLAARILGSSLAALADAIPARVGDLIVFNSLNWRRSGEVTYDLVDGDVIVDSSSDQPVAVETLRTGRNFRHVSFIARNIPAVGYKIYLIRHSSRRARELAADATQPLEDRIGAEGSVPSEAAAGPAGSLSGTTLENPYYRIEFDPATGSVRSIFDKELGRELVDTASPYRFGQYVYVTGGDMPPGQLNGLLQYHRPPPVMTPHGADKGRIVSIRRTPYGWSADLESSGVNTPRIATEIQLFEAEKKIEFVEDVSKFEVYRREGAYFAFPFAMDHPQFQYEIQNGAVDPAKDMLSGAGLDWFSVQHWISVQQDGVSASVLPLDSSIAALGDVIRGTWDSAFGVRPGWIFCNLVNNYHAPRQLYNEPSAAVEDTIRFRFVITSAPATDPAALSRRGWEETTPLEYDEVQSQDREWPGRPRLLPGPEGSFLDAADPALLLDTWKPAEDGHGTILRFIDLGGAPRMVSVNVPLLNLRRVQLTNAVERNLRDLAPTGSHSFAFDIRPHEIVSIRLEGSPVLPVPAGDLAEPRYI